MSASHSTAAAPRRFQFNLATLLLVMAWIAVSCVALRTPTVAWSGAIYCLTLLALATSLLAVIYRTEASRAFAVGFLVCGLGYATSLFVVEHQFTSGVPLYQAPATRLAYWLFEKVHANSVQTVTVPAGGMGGMGGPGAGGFGGGGMQPGGGGGFFSVDSSEQAVQNDASAASGTEGSGSAGGDPTPLTEGGLGSPDDGSSSGTTGDPMGGEGAGGMGMGGGGMGMPMSGGMPMGGMPGMGSSPGGMGMGMATYTTPLYDSTNFTVIVHCTLTVLLGIIGGIIAQWLYCTRRKESR